MSDIMNDPDWQALIDADPIIASDSDTSVATRNRHVPDINLPLSDVSTYQTISITEVELPDTATTELTGPLDLLAEPSDSQSAGVAVGVILSFEQAWRMSGLSLGRLLHSLCLAPGEVTQVAMVDWKRESSGSSSETVAAQEQQSRSVSRERDTQSITDAVSSELQRGGSSASSFAVHAQGGASFLGFGGSAASNSSAAQGANWSTGERSATGTSQQRIQQQTNQHASNARAQQATLVQEVSESETEQFSTRVVANYNHMHSLNMQYYEVLQNYELQAKPVKAERCLFIPMDVGPFTLDMVKQFDTALSRAAELMGKVKLAKTIGTLRKEQQDKDKELTLLLKRRKESEQEAQKLYALVDTLHASNNNASNKLGAANELRDQALHEHKDTLAELNIVSRDASSTERFFCSAIKKPRSRKGAPGCQYESSDTGSGYD